MSPFLSVSDDVDCFLRIQKVHICCVSQGSVRTSIGRGGSFVAIFLQIQSKFITIERGLTKLLRQQNGAIFSLTSYVRPSCHSQEMDKAR